MVVVDAAVVVDVVVVVEGKTPQVPPWVNVPPDMNDTVPSCAHIDMLFGIASFK